MRRAKFIGLVGGAAVAWPLAVRAQRSPMQVIGFLSPQSPGAEKEFLAAFRDGLNEAGFLEGKNLAIEFRFAEGQYDRLQKLAEDLIANRVAVIATTGGAQPVRAVRAVTQTIPVVFASGSDPVQDGLVQSLNRPGVNTTGVHIFTASLGPKRLVLLHELVRRDRPIAVLINPGGRSAKAQEQEIQKAASGLGRPVFFLNATTDSEIDQAFATLVQQGAAGVLMSADPFFNVRRDQLVALAGRSAVPVMYEWTDFVRSGGLMSYCSVRTHSFLQAGTYVGRILKGAKVADLPIQQSTKFEFVINLKTAKALGLAVPASLLAQADKVIE